jgi:hypothetical protein
MRSRLNRLLLLGLIVAVWELSISLQPQPAIYALGGAGVFALLVAPLFIYALLRIALAGLIFDDFDCDDVVEDFVSRGELERLVQVKNQGALLHRSQSSRTSAAKTRTMRTAQRLQVEERPERILDRLVQQKHSGAWGPLVPPAIQNE